MPTAQALRQRNLDGILGLSTQSDFKSAVVAPALQLP